MLQNQKKSIDKYDVSKQISYLNSSMTLKINKRQKDTWSGSGSLIFILKVFFDQDKQALISN